jgi:hypothetical protein
LVLFFKKELLAFFLLARLGYGPTIKAADGPILYRHG